MDPDVLDFYKTTKWVDLGQSNRPKSVFDRGGAVRNGAAAKDLPGKGRNEVSRRLAVPTLGSQASIISTRRLDVPTLSSQASITSKVEVIDLTLTDSESD